MAPQFSATSVYAVAPLRYAPHKLYMLNVAIKLTDNGDILDDVLNIDTDNELSIDSLHFSSERDDNADYTPWFILEAVQESSDNNSNELSITIDASCLISDVKLTFLDINGDKIKLKQIKTNDGNQWRYSNITGAAQTVIADFKTDTGDKYRLETTIRKSFQDEISSMPDYQPNCEHLWILRKFGWSEEIREREYQTDWMALSKSVFSVIDKWDEASKNKSEDATKLINAFNWKGSQYKSGTNIDYCWLPWEIGAQELAIRKPSDGQ